MSSQELIIVTTALMIIKMEAMTTIQPSEESPQGYPVMNSAPLEIMKEHKHEFGRRDGEEMSCSERCRTCCGGH
ncbi:hypothetical protein DM860_010579 [Cuscuta australis]|uniref:Uncharacterized protein n=1 Tax=Cuscuta australis TaxID=267555 RepID=A0A328E5Y7_9ASTE|nr:hypothetical protein DM860_010579 [Cuscuta australis]